MSHQTLATAWQSLREVDDLGMILRDVVGNFILRSCRSNYHPIETPQRFLDYCLELSTTLDAIRFMHRTSQHPSTFQDDLVSAVLHLLQHIAYELGGSKGIITQASYIHILGHTISSAIWTLRCCASNISHDLRQLLARAAQRVLSKTPVHDQRLWLIQSLVNLLSNLYSSDIAYDSNEGEISWITLRDANDSERLGIIREIVTSATDPNIAAVDRIMAALNLCHLYWDTDILLLESYHHLRRTGNLAKFFAGVDDSTAIHLALSTRFAIQEQLTVLGTSGSSWQDALNIESHILFRPGLALSCTQDTCSCPFDLRVRRQLVELRSKLRSNLFPAHINAVHAKCAISDLPNEFFDNAYQRFEERLPSRMTAKFDEFRDRISQCSHDTVVPNYPPEAGRMDASRLVDQKAGSDRKFLAKSRSMSQPNITRQFSTARPPMPRSTTTTEESTEAGSEEASSPTPNEMPIPIALLPGMHRSKASIHNTQSTTTVTNVRPTNNKSSNPETEDYSPPPLTHSPRQPVWSASAMASNDSLTTATSSKLNTSSADSRAAFTLWSNEKIRITTPTETTPFFGPPVPMNAAGVEKIYPEVATTPIVSLEPDSLSLFSEGESMMTKNSSVKPNPSRKWSTFLKTSKRSGTQFVIPKTRFSASGKLVFVWTRYGGGYYEISNPEGLLFHSIDVQDIIMMACGTSRYAVVARCNEGYTLGVYDLGHGAPTLRVSLNRQPSAMDVSLNDRYIAIKYTHFVRIYDLEKNAKIDHRLPKSEDEKLGPGGNLVAFAHDSESFMASTRLGPEKVLTYWSDCMDKSRAVIAQSSAPCGHMDDHGLTGLTVCGPKIRGIATGFLSTFTEKGSPVIIAMSQKNAGTRPLRDAKGAVGTRIHNAAMYVDPATGKAHLVVVNQNNEVFWVTDLFGRDQEVQKVRTLKRTKSMKPELLVSMYSTNEASIFWMDKGSRSATLIKVGREGGMIKVTDDLRLDIEPLCSG